MNLCFGTFFDTVFANRKFPSSNKIDVGRELVSFIDPHGAAGADPRVIYFYIDRTRELPKYLKPMPANIPQLSDQFSRFLDDFISQDHEKFRRDLIELIEDDAVMLDTDKEQLFDFSAKLKLPVFLAELFVFIVNCTINTVGGAKPRASRKRYNLLKEMRRATGDKTLEKLARIAVQEHNVEALSFCLEKMTNSIYIARVLTLLSINDDFSDNPNYMMIFHKTFSAIGNNKYRHEIFDGCLRTGYFAEHPEQLIENHMAEYTNDRYLFDTLISLCELGFRNEAERYSRYLTNKTYIKRLNVYIEGH